MRDSTSDSIDRQPLRSVFVVESVKVEIPQRPGKEDIAGQARKRLDRKQSLDHAALGVVPGGIRVVDEHLERVDREGRNAGRGDRRCSPGQVQFCTWDQRPIQSNSAPARAS